jgi:hypothetical protein
VTKLEPYTEDPMFSAESTQYCARQLYFPDVLATQIDQFCNRQRELMRLSGSIRGLCMGALVTSSKVKEFLVGLEIGQFFVCIGIINNEDAAAAEQVVNSPAYSGRIRTAVSTAISLKRYSGSWPRP